MRRIGAGDVRNRIRVVEHERIGPCRSTQEGVPWPRHRAQIAPAGNHPCGWRSTAVPPGDVSPSARSGRPGSGAHVLVADVRLRAPGSSAAGLPIRWCGRRLRRLGVTGHYHQVPMAVIEIFRTIPGPKQTWRRLTVVIDDPTVCEFPALDSRRSTLMSEGTECALVALVTTVSASRSTSSPIGPLRFSSAPVREVLQRISIGWTSRNAPTGTIFLAV